MRLHHQARRRAGATSVEFAAVALLVFLLLFGILEYARFLFVLHLATNAARDAARFAAVRTSGGVLLTEPDGTVRQPTPAEAEGSLGLAISNFNLGLVMMKPTDTANTRTYTALRAGGSVQLVGIPGITLTATMEVRVNRAGDSNTSNPTPAAIDFTRLPGNKLTVSVGGAVVGWFGEVHPAVRERFGIEARVYAFDLDLTKLPLAEPAQMRAIPRFPGSARDVSLLLAETIPAARVEEVIAAVGEKLVTSVRLLEDYRDAKLGVRDQTIEPDGEYAELERLVRLLNQRGARVVLINTPESALLRDLYESGPYYRSYIAFLEGLAARVPGARFYDFRGLLPVEDFNDWHHVTYIGAIKLGAAYTELVRPGVLAAVQPPGQGS